MLSRVSPVLILAALLTAGCADAGQASDPDGSASSDAAAASDRALVAEDLAPSSDLAVPDLAAPGDATSSADLASSDGNASDGPTDLGKSDGLIYDFAGLPKCKPSSGAGNLVICLQSGTCGAHKYTLSCDHDLCTCLVDGQIVATFKQFNACLTLDGAWSNGCGF
ncbi:MAG: hypothetical protein EXR72_20460 [Myxococcales bacterium]|nr:hypothetical protein [Myxococcales bacterium]